MNQLAKAIRNLSDSEKDPELSNLTPLELMALKSIGNLVGMSPIDLATHLRQEDGPTEWLIGQHMYASAKTLD